MHSGYYLAYTDVSVRLFSTKRRFLPYGDLFGAAPTLERVKFEIELAFTAALAAEVLTPCNLLALAAADIGRVIAHYKASWPRQVLQAVHSVQPCRTRFLRGQTQVSARNWRRAVP